MSRCIDADALLADFKARAIKARNWKENAILNGNEEATIRADATIAFLTEVKLTIENAPTIVPTQEVVVVPSEVIKQVADCVVNTINNIDWSKAIDAYKEINNDKPKGRWIYHKSPSESRECSNCGVWLDWSLVRNSFCPNCGADMRGDV